MGLVGWLMGFDRSNGASNSLMAGLLWDTAEETWKTSIADRVARIIVDTQRRGTPDTALQDLNYKSRLVKTNFIGLACIGLKIYPPIDKIAWHNIHPYRVASRITERDIIGVQRRFRIFRGVEINWPGDDVKIDFLGASRMVQFTSAQSKGASNTLLASLLMETADSQTKMQVARAVAILLFDTGMGHTPEECLRNLNKRSRITQANQIAMACSSLKIAPPVDYCVWYIVPALEIAQTIKPDDILDMQRWFRDHRNVRIEWPGDDKIIDLLEKFGLPRQKENLIQSAAHSQQENLMKVC